MVIAAVTVTVLSVLIIWHHQDGEGGSHLGAYNDTHYRPLLPPTQLMLPLHVRTTHLR